MKPGATTRPPASMVFLAGARMRPISVILPAVMPTSAEGAGAPVTSTTLPPLMRRSSMTRLPGQNTAMKVAIIGGTRIPFARASGAYNEASNQDMLTAALKALVERFHLKGQVVGEVAAGAVIKHSRDWNLARESTLGSGLHPTTPAYDLQRACGTSLSAIVQLGYRLALGEIDCAIGGGPPSTSAIPLSYGNGLQKNVLSNAKGR